MKSCDKLMLVLIILVAFDVLINFVNTLGLAMLAYEVKPLISKAEVKLDSLEMPDFSSVNSMIVKADRIIELVDVFPFDKVKDFIGVWNRLDDANITDEFIEMIPSMKEFYVNEPCVGGVNG